MSFTAFVRIDAQTEIPLPAFGIRAIYKFDKKLYFLRLKTARAYAFVYLCPDCDLKKEKFVIDGLEYDRDDIEIFPVYSKPQKLRLV
jgi:hypothetical protein